MNSNILKQIQFLKLSHLEKNYHNFLKSSEKEDPSYSKFLDSFLDQEYQYQKERRRVSRIKRAKIPEVWSMETFPFSKQVNLKKKIVLQMYDSMSFVEEPWEMIFIGPTGCGKSGLATSFLTHSLNNGYRGLFIDFIDLIDILFKSIGDHSEKKVLARLEAYDILLIDELGYQSVNQEEAGLFFELMKNRHKKKTTLITTQLGFDEWGSFLKNQHLTAALLDRITVQCTVFDMQRCISIRPKNIVYATHQNKSTSKPK